MRDGRSSHFARSEVYFRRVPVWVVGGWGLGMSQGSQPSVKLSEMEFRVVKPLGQGAGSSVFQINDTKKGGYYALKIVKRHSAEDDVYIAQALQEAEVGPKLNHPSLMKIYDHRVKKAWFKVATVELLMEYIDGKTLHAHIRDRNARGGYTCDELRRIAADVCQGVAVPLATCSATMALSAPTQRRLMCCARGWIPAASGRFSARIF